MSEALSIGVTSLAGACGCDCCWTGVRVVVDPVRCICAFCWKDGCLKLGGRARPAFDGVRAGAGVAGNMPGVGRRGVYGGRDILLSPSSFHASTQCAPTCW